MSAAARRRQAVPSSWQDASNRCRYDTSPSRTIADRRRPRKPRSPTRPARIDRYATAMAAGKWRLTARGYRFRVPFSCQLPHLRYDGRARLTNGRHRLNACVRREGILRTVVTLFASPFAVIEPEGPGEGPTRTVPRNADPPTVVSHLSTAFSTTRGGVPRPRGRGVPPSRGRGLSRREKSDSWRVALRSTIARAPLPPRVGLIH